MSAVVAGWIGAALVSIVVQVVLVAVWDVPSGVGSSAGRAAAQAAAGAEVNLSDFDISQFTLLQVPLWVTLSLVAWGIARRHGMGLREAVGLTQRWFDVPLGLACGLLSQLLLVPLVYLPLLRFIDEDDIAEPARQIVGRADDPAGVAILVVGIVLVAPVVEEVYFRGLLLRALWGRMGRLATVVLSAVLFGLAHVQLLQLPALVVVGLVAGALVTATGRLAPAIWAHAAFNGFTVVQLLR